MCRLGRSTEVYVIVLARNLWNSVFRRSVSSRMHCSAFCRQARHSLSPCVRALHRGIVRTTVLALNSRACLLPGFRRCARTCSCRGKRYTSWCSLRYERLWSSTSFVVVFYPGEVMLQHPAWMRLAFAPVIVTWVFLRDRLVVFVLVLADRESRYLWRRRSVLSSFFF